MTALGVSVISAGLFPSLSSLASGMMSLVRLASVYMWVVGQHLRLSLLTHRTRAYGYPGAALLAGYLTFLCGAVPDQAGCGAARALLAGGLCCQIASMWSDREWGMEGLCFGGLICCLALLAVAACFRPWYVGFDAILGTTLVWSALYFGAAIAMKTVRISEFRILIRAYRHPELSPEPTEQPL